MTVVGISTVEKTFLQAVNEVLVEIGDNQTSTLLNASDKRIVQAMQAVRHAYQMVFHKTKWEFKRAWQKIELIEDQMWYETADDYNEASVGPSQNLLEPTLTYKKYEDMLAMYPDLRAFPPGSGVIDSESNAQLANQAHNFGNPEYFTITHGYIGLMPIPDGDYVDQEGNLYVAYWKNATQLTSDNDIIDFPQELWLVHHNLATGRLKKILMMDDWAADYQDGIKGLRDMSSSKEEPLQENIYYNTGVFDYNE